MFIRILAVALSFLFSISQIFAQDVEEIIKKSMEARGDLNTYKNMTSLTISGQQSQTGMSIIFHYYMKDNKKFKLESEAMGQKQTMAYDGDTMWVESGGQLQIIPEEHAEKYLPQLKQMQGFISGPFMKYKEDGKEIEFSGNVKEDGRDAFTLKLIDDEKELFLYVDKNNYELFKIWTSVTGQQGEETDVELNFSDYKKVNGFSYPHKIDLVMGEGGTIGIIIEKIEMNAKIDDSVFEAPKKPDFTISDFNKIKVGWRLDEVTNVLGTGNLSSSSESGKDDSKVEIYEWESNDGGIIMITFIAGKVKSKTQVGLK